MLVLFSASFAIAQNAYNMIDHEKNIIVFPAASYEKYKTFLHVFNKVNTARSGKVNILHLGDSHIQAGYFTSVVRNKLKMFIHEEVSDYGFVFPYRIARTNSPTGYDIDFTGNWDACFKMKDHEKCECGLSGITISTNDTLFRLIIQLKGEEGLNYAFNKLSVFCNLDESPYQVYLPDQGVYYKMRNDYLLGCLDFELDSYVDTLIVEFSRVNKNLKAPFKLYGLLLSSDKPGMQYHTVGYNGATLSSFLESELLLYHLIPMNPNLVIVSLGTNNGIYRPFNQEKFLHEYDSLIVMIRDLFPEVPVILSTPNDNRFKGKANYNNIKIAQSVYQLAEKHDLAVWDFYDIMGGMGSVKYWYDAGFVQKDMLHFTKNGYVLQGELFYNALMKTYIDFLNIGDTLE